MKLSKIRFILILGIFVGFAGVFAVKKSGLMQNSGVNNIEIMHPIGAKKNDNAFTFLYEPANWQDGKIKFQVNGKSMDDTQLNIESMEILEQYNIVKPNLYKSGDQELIPDCQMIASYESYAQYECNFRPIATKFKLNLDIIHNQDQTKESHSIEIYITPPVLTENNKINRNEEYTDAIAPAGGCGNWSSGTTRQRIFDCSMKVLDHSGKVDYFRLSKATDRKAFKFSNDSGQIDKFWFLVSCPNNGLAYQCAWLSPELKPGSPAVGANEFLSFPADLVQNLPEKWWMSSYTKTNSQYNNRILWSGMILAPPYIFWQVNEHVGYQYGNDVQIHENWFPIFEYLHFGGKSEFYTDICQTNYNLYKNGQANVDSTIWLDKNFYDWRVPSYPQITTLTGYPLCNAGQYIADGSYKNRLDHKNTKYTCLDTDNVNGPEWGFSASFVPGFYRSTGEKAYRYLWSSGEATLPSPNPFTRSYHGWGFDSRDGYVKNWDRDDKHGVRCATMEW